jgi:hypothetical protein
VTTQLLASELENTIASPTPNFHEEVRKGKRVLSYSQIATFLSCRHKWYLQYYLGLHTLRPSDPLVLGDAVHQALADYFEHGTEPEVFLNTWLDKQVGKPNTNNSFVERMLDSLDDLSTNSLHATRTAIKRIEEEGWAPLELYTEGQGLGHKKAVELELRTTLPFAPAFEYFASHIDLIAYHPGTGRTWLVDYKVRKNFSTGAFEEVNLQAMIYALMCLFQGIPITGTATLEIRAQPPEIPKLNQDGTMSRAKIATTWEVYSRELERCWLNPKDYGEMRYKLNTPFTRLTQEFRPPDMLEKVWQKIIVPTAELMSNIMQTLDEVHFSPDIARNLGPYQCNGCGVREVCLAGLYDRDIQHALNSRDGRVNEIKNALAAGAL